MPVVAPCVLSPAGRDGDSLLKSRSLVQNLYHVGASRPGWLSAIPPALKSCRGLELCNFLSLLREPYGFSPLVS